MGVMARGGGTSCAHISIGRCCCARRRSLFARSALRARAQQRQRERSVAANVLQYGEWRADILAR